MELLNQMEQTITIRATAGAWPPCARQRCGTPMHAANAPGPCADAT